MPPELIAALPHGAWFVVVTILYVLLREEKKARIASDEAARVREKELQTALATERKERIEENSKLMSMLLSFSRDGITATQQNTAATMGVVDGIVGLGEKLDKLIEARLSSRSRG